MHPPFGQVFERRFAECFGESDGECGSRHGDLIGEGSDRPWFLGVLVHESQCGADGRVYQCLKPGKAFGRQWGAVGVETSDKEDSHQAIDDGLGAGFAGLGFSGDELEDAVDVSGGAVALALDDLDIGHQAEERTMCGLAREEADGVDTYSCSAAAMVQDFVLIEVGGAEEFLKRVFGGFGGIGQGVGGALLHDDKVADIEVNEPVGLVGMQAAFALAEQVAPAEPARAMQGPRGGQMKWPGDPASQVEILHGRSECV